MRNSLLDLSCSNGTGNNIPSQACRRRGNDEIATPPRRHTIRPPKKRTGERQCACVLSAAAPGLPSSFGCIISCSSVPVSNTRLSGKSHIGLISARLDSRRLPRSADPGDSFYRLLRAAEADLLALLPDSQASGAQGDESSVAELLRLVEATRTKVRASSISTDRIRRRLTSKTNDQQAQLTQDTGKDSHLKSPKPGLPRI
jgi:hypothetical protein